MTPQLHSGTFVRTISPADGNNIVLILDFNQILSQWKEFEADYIVKHLVVLEDFQAKVGLFSLQEADWPNTNALASQSAENAEDARIKKQGQKVYLEIYHAWENGPWQIKGEEILQNKNSLEMPWGLMAPFLSTNPTALLDATLKIGVKIASKAQGIGGLKNQDYIRLFGSWRVQSSREKKNNGNEELAAAIESLQLAIYGRLTNLSPGVLLGRNTNTGIVEQIPQSVFAKSTDVVAAINAAIDDLVAGAPGALNTLDELAAAFGDDANFSTTIINQITAITNQITAINNAISIINNVSRITILTPLNIAANTWFTVGTFANIGFASTEALYAVTVYIQYGDGTTSPGHWQYSGGGFISSIQWKAAGAQLPTSFKMEAHTVGDFTCSVRFTLTNVNRALQVMFDREVVTQAPSVLRVSLKRMI